MKAIKEHIKKDLSDLNQKNILSSAVKLNEDLGHQFVSNKCVPLYFNGKFDANTVLVMLNPGFEKENYSFSNDDNYKNKTDNELINLYIENCINYGNKFRSTGNTDPFDLKQAAFLYHFDNSGISIPDFFDSKDKELKLKAQENVLMQKLQLELIPYCSREFKAVLDNQKLATKNIDAFKPYIERVLDAIIEHKRNNIIFCAKQFMYLFQAYKNAGYGNITFGDEIPFKIENLQKKVYFKTVSINYKSETINAGIAYSFPRRDLPSAHKQMCEYGKLCYNELKKFKNS